MSLLFVVYLPCLFIEFEIIWLINVNTVCAISALPFYRV